MYYLVAIAEHLSNNRRRQLSDEFAQRSVTSAEDADIEPPKTIHQRVGVQMLTGSVSRKQPRVVGSACAEVWSVGDVAFEQFGEWLRDGRRSHAEFEGQSIGRYEHLGHRYGCDLHEWLGVEEQQGSSDAVGERFAVAGQELSNPFKSLALCENPDRLGLPMSERD